MVLFLCFLSSCSTVSSHQFTIHHNSPLSYTEIPFSVMLIHCVITVFHWPSNLYDPLSFHSHQLFFILSHNYLLFLKNNTCLDHKNPLPQPIITFHWFIPTFHRSISMVYSLITSGHFPYHLVHCPITMTHFAITMLHCLIIEKRPISHHKVQHHITVFYYPSQQSLNKYPQFLNNNPLSYYKILLFLMFNCPLPSNNGPLYYHNDTISHHKDLLSNHICLLCQYNDPFFYPKYFSKQDVQLSHPLSTCFLFTMIHLPISVVHSPMPVIHCLVTIIPCLVKLSTVLFQCCIVS